MQHAVWAAETCTQLNCTFAGKRHSQRPFCSIWQRAPACAAHLDRHSSACRPAQPVQTSLKESYVTSHASARGERSAHSVSRRRNCAAAARPITSSQDFQEVPIENLDREYCDDFVCTTSPAVEQNVRSLSRDLQRPKAWTKSLFCAEINYQGFLRSFKGLDRYQRNTFISDNVEGALVTIERIRMEDRGTAVIHWQLQGRILGLLDIDADVMSTFTLNLLTGRAETHRDEWDLSRCSLPARFALITLRAGWAARQRATDWSEDGGGILDRLAPDDGVRIESDPSDPRKFFEDTSRRQNFDDAIKFATLLAILWTLEKLGRELL